MFVPRIFHAVWGLRSSVRVESKLFLATPTYSIIPGIAVVRTICSSYTTRHGIALSTPAYSITVYQVPGTVVSLFRGFVIAERVPLQGEASARTLVVPDVDRNNERCNPSTTAVPFRGQTT